MPEHPDRDLLERFSRGAVSLSQGQWIEDHLRSGCPLCQRRVDDLLSQLHDPEEQVWSRLLVKLEGRLELIRQERALAPDLVEELLAIPPEERGA
ncbi:MAG TPA: hypothetical protein VFR31_10205, partial [Thermoanaerobaculia bacterium]|nr:hypothetical protein [Thermoanaerobaculia bacterium]